MGRYPPETPKLMSLGHRFLGPKHYQKVIGRICVPNIIKLTLSTTLSKSHQCPKVIENVHKTSRITTICVPKSSKMDCVPNPTKSICVPKSTICAPIFFLVLFDDFGTCPKVIIFLLFCIIFKDSGGLWGRTDPYGISRA